VVFILTMRSFTIYTKLLTVNDGALALYGANCTVKDGALAL